MTLTRIDDEAPLAGQDAQVISTRLAQTLQLEGEKPPENRNYRQIVEIVRQLPEIDIESIRDTSMFRRYGRFIVLSKKFQEECNGTANYRNLDMIVDSIAELPESELAKDLKAFTYLEEAADSFIGRRVKRKKERKNKPIVAQSEINDFEKQLNRDFRKKDPIKETMLAIKMAQAIQAEGRKGPRNRDLKTIAQIAAEMPVINVDVAENPRFRNHAQTLKLARAFQVESNKRYRIQDLEDLADFAAQRPPEELESSPDALKTFQNAASELRYGLKGNRRMNERFDSDSEKENTIVNFAILMVQALKSEGNKARYQRDLKSMATMAAACPNIELERLYSTSYWQKNTRALMIARNFQIESKRDYHIDDLHRLAETAAEISDNSLEYDPKAQIHFFDAVRKIRKRMTGEDVIFPVSSQKSIDDLNYLLKKSEFDDTVVIAVTQKIMLAIQLAQSLKVEGRKPGKLRDLKTLAKLAASSPNIDLDAFKESPLLQNNIQALKLARAFQLESKKDEFMNDLDRFAEAAAEISESDLKSDVYAPQKFQETVRSIRKKMFSNDILKAFTPLDSKKGNNLQSLIGTVEDIEEQELRAAGKNVLLAIRLAEALKIEGRKAANQSNLFAMASMIADMPVVDLSTLQGTSIWRKYARILMLARSFHLESKKITSDELYRYAEAAATMPDQELKYDPNSYNLFCEMVQSIHNEKKLDDALHKISSGATPLLDGPEDLNVSPIKIISIALKMAEAIKAEGLKPSNQRQLETIATLAASIPPININKNQQLFKEFGRALLLARAFQVESQKTHSIHDLDELAELAAHMPNEEVQCHQKSFIEFQNVVQEMMIEKLSSEAATRAKSNNLIHDNDFEKRLHSIGIEENKKYIKGNLTTKKLGLMMAKAIQIEGRKEPGERDLESIASAIFMIPTIDTNTLNNCKKYERVYFLARSFQVESKKNHQTKDLDYLADLATMVPAYELKGEISSPSQFQIAVQSLIKETREPDLFPENRLLFLTNWYDYRSQIEIKYENMNEIEFDNNKEHITLKSLIVAMTQTIFSEGKKSYNNRNLHSLASITNIIPTIDIDTGAIGEQQKMKYRRALLLLRAFQVESKKEYFIENLHQLADLAASIPDEEYPPQSRSLTTLQRALQSILKVDASAVEIPETIFGTNVKFDEPEVEEKVDDMEYTHLALLMAQAIRNEISKDTINQNLESLATLATMLPDINFDGIKGTYLWKKCGRALMLARAFQIESKKEHSLQDLDRIGELSLTIPENELSYNPDSTIIFQKKVQELLRPSVPLKELAQTNEDDTLALLLAQAIQQEGKKQQSMRRLNMIASCAQIIPSIIIDNNFESPEMKRFARSLMLARAFQIESRRPTHQQDLDYLADIAITIPSSELQSDHESYENLIVAVQTIKNEQQLNVRQAIERSEEFNKNPDLNITTLAIMLSKAIKAEALKSPAYRNFENIATLSLMLPTIDVDALLESNRLQKHTRSLLVATAFQLESRKEPRDQDLQRWADMALEIPDTELSCNNKSLEIFRKAVRYFSSSPIFSPRFQWNDFEKIPLDSNRSYRRATISTRGTMTPSRHSSRSASPLGPRDTILGPRETILGSRETSPVEAVKNRLRRTTTPNRQRSSSPKWRSNSTPWIPNNHLPWMKPTSPYMFPPASPNMFPPAYSRSPIPAPRIHSTSPPLIKRTIYTPRDSIAVPSIPHSQVPMFPNMPYPDNRMRIPFNNAYA